VNERISSAQDVPLLFIKCSTFLQCKLLDKTLDMYTSIKVMIFNTTFNNISVISGGQFYWWRKPEDPKKTTDLSLTNFITQCCIEYTLPE
jgi:hypothetical protein